TLVRTASIEVLNNKPIGKSKLKIKTPSVSAELLSGGGRAMVKARKNIFVVDSVPPLKGPNETMNPLDVLLAAQATCVLFVAEYVYKKEKASSDGLQAKVTATFNPKGVKDGSVNPRITSMKIDLSGGDEKAQTKAQEFLKGSCPIYTTLSDSFEIELM
ncbi:MAG: OsmC family protein, partial [Bdellovibrionales bacterium]|nr:OsmC family protein [Bdellovibrionales bacterium]